MKTQEAMKTVSISNSRMQATRGFTLLEVLVALVVLSIGLLGLSGLQTTSLRSNHNALLRSQATIVTHDIIDRMRANSDSARSGNYDIEYASSPASVACNVDCSALQVAQMDVEEWRSYVGRLPAGESEIVVSAAGIAEVKIRWGDNRDGSKLEFVARAQL